MIGALTGTSTVNRHVLRSAGRRDSRIRYGTRADPGWRAHTGARSPASVGTDFSEAFPLFPSLVATPLTFSIATGLSLGMLSFTFIKVGAGKYREISPLIWILSVLFLLRYAFLGAE